MMVIDNKYEIADTVYNRTEVDQNEWMVTAITVRPGPQIVYEASCGGTTRDFYEFELSKDKDVLKSMQNDD
jgi:hypothetical protein